MTERPRLEHQPALDGLRGIAVAGVIAFHLGHLDGGFLGVDLFFTLSGYLITRLLLIERDGTGAVDLVGFWKRRAWRLLPALFLVLTAVAVHTWIEARPDELGGIRDGGLASLLYVTNWFFLATGDGYWNLFTAPTPFDHLWSLAIEEQFYVVWPLVFIGLAARANGKVLAWVTAIATAATGLWMSVGDPAEVPNEDRLSPHAFHGDPLDVLGPLKCARDAKNDIAILTGHAAAGNVHIFALQGANDVVEAESVVIQPPWIDQHTQFSGQAAGQLGG